MLQLLISCPKLGVYYHLECLFYPCYCSENAEHFIVLPIFFPDMYPSVPSSGM